MIIMKQYSYLFHSWKYDRDDVWRNNFIVIKWNAAKTVYEHCVTVESDNFVYTHKRKIKEFELEAIRSYSSVEFVSAVNGID